MRAPNFARKLKTKGFIQDRSRVGEAGCPKLDAHGWGASGLSLYKTLSLNLSSPIAHTHIGR